MDFLERPIAITDVETTGLDAAVHEIVEVGLVIINQQTLEIVDTFAAKVRPLHIERASAAALAINGYAEADWKDAVELCDALAIYGEKTRDAMFAAHNVTFDWSFVHEAFRKTGVENRMDYHRIDLFTLAWSKLQTSGLKKFNLNEIAKYLGIPEEPMPHRALNGAMIAYQVLRRIAARSAEEQRP